MRLLRDLLFLLDAALKPLLGLVVVALLLVLTARPGCACITKEKAYVIAMRYELGRIVASQDSLRARAAVPGGAPVDPYVPPADGNVRLTVFRPTAHGYVVEVAMPTLTATRCRVDRGAGEPVAVCGDDPPRPLPRFR